MSNKNYFRYLNLQLFNDGEGGTSDGGATGEGAGVPDLQAAATAKAKAKNPLADVRYGIQDEDSEGSGAQVPAQQTEQTEEDLSAEFEEAIKGKYKDLFSKRVQETVKQRLKGTQEAAGKYKALSPVIDALAKRYGVSVDDIEAIAQAVDEDNTYYEQEAMERGITVDQLKLERKYKALKAREAERARQEEADRVMQGWLDQAEQTKQVYPGFDFEAEIGNPQFAELLKSNVDVRTAYEVVHKDEIIGGAMQYAVQQTASKIANKIRSGNARPQENGTRSQSSAVVKSDVSQLSKADRAEIARRVAAGERITF